MSNPCKPGHCDCSVVGSVDSSNVFSLFLKIDINNLVCLNESETDSGRKVFREWDDRLKRDCFVESDVDEELLFNIPFTGIVKLKKICVIGPSDSSHPKVLKLFNVNSPLQFEDCAKLEPSQILSLAIDTDGSFHYPVKQTKFQNLSNLSLYFVENYGDDITRIDYIGLQGEYVRDFRDKVTITNYEIAANPADHKNPMTDFVSHGVS